MKKLIFRILSVFGYSNELPEGYSFLCCPEGKVTLKFPDGSISPSVWETKYGAARFARYWEKEKNKPFIRKSDKYQWSSICE
jgi:hypothetical protein